MLLFTKTVSLTTHFAKKSQNLRSNCSNRSIWQSEPDALLFSEDYAKTAQAPQTQKERRPRSGSDALFNLLMCAVNGANFALWAISAPLTGTLAGTLGPAGGAAQTRRWNCTNALGNHREPHGNGGEPHGGSREPQKSGGEPQRTTRQRPGTAQPNPSLWQNRRKIFRLVILRQNITMRYGYNVTADRKQKRRAAANRSPIESDKTGKQEKVTDFPQNEFTQNSLQKSRKYQILFRCKRKQWLSGLRAEWQYALRSKYRQAHRLNRKERFPD